MTSSQGRAWNICNRLEHTGPENQELTRSTKPTCHCTSNDYQILIVLIHRAVLACTQEASKHLVAQRDITSVRVQAYGPDQSEVHRNTIRANTERTLTQPVGDSLTKARMHLDSWLYWCDLGTSSIKLALSPQSPFLEVSNSFPLQDDADRRLVKPTSACTAPSSLTESTHNELA